ncbi:RNA pseudouridine synthase [bacterium]|nr:RNA pseudouridine synthase [bacterium]
MTNRKRSISRYRPRGIEILYEDLDILVVDKPAGLLTVETRMDKVRTAHQALTEYVRKGATKSRKQIFVVHRLDRDTSGLLIFAKTREAHTILQANWKNTKKIYLAVVHGKLSKKEDTITSYLVENRDQFVHSTSDSKIGKLSHTCYKVVKETRNFSLLEINLLTGRKNQIRVHLADRGHPIVGDKKYGENERGNRRLALHAKSISFNHPTSGKQLSFETKVPAYFEELVGRYI